MFKQAIFPHILAIAVVAILVGTLPSLAQHGGFRGRSVSGFHGGGGAFHGGGVGGFNQGGNLNTFHGGGVDHFHHGGFCGCYYGSHHHHGGYYGHTYYYGGYYGYPWYGGFSIGFGFGPFGGFWGYPYIYGYYRSPYPYYPYLSYHGPRPADYRNDSSPEQNRESPEPAAEQPSRCDYRYETRATTNNLRLHH
jgi:hypothetical protein